MTVENESLDSPEQVTQILSFSLGSEHYGVNILRVQEIRGWAEVREIPNTPDYIKGVLNLRDSIVPIIDLRIRFGEDRVEYNSTTVIIVLSVYKDDAVYLMGVVVDAVSDVLDVDPEDVRPAPNLGARIDTRYIQGMIMIDERMVIVLDSDRMLDRDELAALEALS